MPTFDTPTPISVTVELVVAETEITATDRTDTVVDVRPSDPSDPLDTKAATQTRVEFADGRLLVRTPKLATLFSTRYGTVQVAIQLPAGSRLRGTAAMGQFHCSGRLDECRLKTSAGRVSVDHVAGDAEITAAGELRLRRIDGSATVKNINGDTWVGEVTGDLRLTSANGNIAIDRARAEVNATTANGHIRIGEVGHGPVSLRTASGELEIGVAEGVAAWLDVRSSAGRVRNQLATADGPGDTDHTVQVRGRTHLGDVVIRRPFDAGLHI
jgi:hypothetical protein